MKTYRLNDITQKEDSCIMGSCPGIYELKELAEGCLFGACPNIYLKKLSDDCIMGGCPEVLSGKDTYVIIGKKVDPKKVSDLGLEGKIADDETILEIGKEILDKAFSKQK